MTWGEASALILALSHEWEETKGNQQLRMPNKKEAVLPQEDGLF